MMKKDSLRWEKIGKCLLCGYSKIPTYLNNVRYWEFKYTFKISKCNRCSFVFLNPRPKKKYISKFYKSSSYWGQDLRKSNSLKQERERSFREIYLLIDNHRNNSIFDVGAGTGLLLSRYKELGWENVDGVEYSKDAVRFAKKAYGLNLLTGDLLDVDVGYNKYDYIVFNNVLEHLYKPLETLIKAKKMLKKNGKIIIAVPNIRSIGFMIYKKDWYPLQPPIHLIHFSPITLSLLLDKSGFKVKSINHINKIHAYYSLFESYRSLVTGRNKKSDAAVKVDMVNDYNKTNKNKFIIKELAIYFGKTLSYLLSYIGFSIKRGENIIVYAEKK